VRPSPYLFTRYIRHLIYSVVEAGVGCVLGDNVINSLAYADDLVLLAPSCRAMQHLLLVLNMQADNLNLSCNVNKKAVLSQGNRAMPQLLFSV